MLDEDIPKEKFAFLDKEDYIEDNITLKKSRGYIGDAVHRFSKNKGAIIGGVIIILLLIFAIIVPFITSFTVSYNDVYYVRTLPKNKMLEKTSFWDGCEKKESSKDSFYYYYAMGEESGHNAVKNQKYKIKENDIYNYRLDSINKIGVIYKNFTKEEYINLQNYQDEKEVQIIYPTVPLNERPKAEQDNKNGNYYYRTKGISKTSIVLDKDGNIIKVYAKYKKENPDDLYFSKMRIEGIEGVEENGEKYYYSYARQTQSGVECRVNYLEYYKYYHEKILKDGIKEPYFLFGTTDSGQDILTCLASGARFSFIFSIVVATVNIIIGGIYGAISGYYGGKIDLIMQRFADILSAVPIMIIITLLKLHMGASGHIIVLFTAFFLTGWIRTANTTRMQFYRYKNQEYVLAARTLGATDSRIILKHVFPNIIGTLVTSCALIIPSMIYSETNLTYLGIVNLSTGNITSVGTLIAAGQSFLSTATFIALFPSVFLALLMLSFNLFGNGLRDAFNPSLRGADE